LAKLFRLSKLGADPEFLWGKVEDDVVETALAHEILTADGGAGRSLLETQVGTDGHAATGELRPPPAHNVRLLLHNIVGTTVELRWS
jgi:hypothetical protein